MSVEDFEAINGAEELKSEEIKHKIMIIKINKLYRRTMPDDELYDAVRGVWCVSIKRAQSVDYVFGVYNLLIVAVYKPSEWFICKNAIDKLPRQDIVLNTKTENRKYFVDQNFERGDPLDENEMFYYGKSIAGLKLNQRAQNPITYLEP